jgi:uncharacterized protein (DUF488 family)
MEIFSAGTSGTTAEKFFRRIASAGVTSIIDTRRHNTSQLAGFSKWPDIEYFASAILDVPYLHELLLAPDETALKNYRSKQIDWREYELHYLRRLDELGVADRINIDRWGERPLLLCSEPTSDQCHRRLAASYLETNLSRAIISRVTHL